MRAHHIKIHGLRFCVRHDERFADGEDCPECVGEDEAKKIKPKAYCETHDEIFESVCPRCAMWKANTLDQDAQEAVAAPPARYAVRYENEATGEVSYAVERLGDVLKHLAPPVPMLRRESDREYLGKMPTPSRPAPPMPAIKAPSEPQSALQVQEGGDHYKKLNIQPVEYIHANGLPFAEGSVIKYVTRWRDKNGIADLKKARHFLDLLIELESTK